MCNVHTDNKNLALGDSLGIEAMCEVLSSMPVTVRPKYHQIKLWRPPEYYPGSPSPTGPEQHHITTPTNETISGVCIQVT